MNDPVTYCPTCKKENPWNAMECQHCGANLAPPETEELPYERTGLAYGTLSSIALGIGQFAALFAAFVYLILCIYFLVNLNFFDAFFNGLLLFFIMLALYVTFKRVESL